MPNSNLPPGVSTNMIPGNRPEDHYFEQVVEELKDSTWNLMHKEPRFDDKAQLLCDNGYDEELSPEETAKRIDEAAEEFTKYLGPETIYLQTRNQMGEPDDIETGEVTWCKDAINSFDEKYYREDRVAEKIKYAIIGMGSISHKINLIISTMEKHEVPVVETTEHEGNQFSGRRDVKEMVEVEELEGKIMGMLREVVEDYEL